jgi:hypothetical protein
MNLIKFNTQAHPELLEFIEGKWFGEKICGVLITSHIDCFNSPILDTFLDVMEMHVNVLGSPFLDMV